GERVEELVEARAELRGRERHGRGIGPRRHLEHVVVADPHEEKARVEIARPAQLRDGTGAEWQPEDEELEQILSRDVVVPDDGARDVAGRDRVEDGGGVLAWYGEVPRAPVRGAAEAEARSVRSTHLARIERVVVVVVEDRQLRRHARAVHEGLGKRRVCPASDDRRGAVDLARVAIRHETTGAEAGQQAVADHDHSPQPERWGGPSRVWEGRQQENGAE